MTNNQLRVFVSLMICATLGLGLTRQDPITGDHYMIIGALLSAIAYLLGGIRSEHRSNQTDEMTKAFDEARHRALFDSEG